jgi:hypothetical protein
MTVAMARALISLTFAFSLLREPFGRPAGTLAADSHLMIS